MPSQTGRDITHPEGAASCNPPGSGRADRIGCFHGDADAGREVAGCSSWVNNQTAAGPTTVNHDNDRQELVSSGSNQYQGSTTARPTGRPVGLSRVKTIGVVSSGGLTTVNVKNRGESVGNVHSGVRPPWLREEVSQEGSIGPSEDDFKKHLSRQRKSKLNPNRVGATFDHTSATAEEWLPSFGRVWTAGRRRQSRHQYQKETGQSKRRKEKRHPATGNQ